MNHSFPLKMASLTYSCRVDLDKYLEGVDTGLSPFFDLDAFVEAEKKRNNNILEDTRCQQHTELEKVIPLWNCHESQYYLISGAWIRQWIRYIFVEDYWVY